MNHLPILQELFESDSIIFMLIGLILSIFIGIKKNDFKKNRISLISCFAIYVICELISNVHTNFLIELILLFAGTIAIGGIIGFLAGTIFLHYKTKIKKEDIKI